jgi:hypothetical protein
MKVGLAFRLYMMRYGPALLAASFTSPSQPLTSKSVTERIKEIFSRRVDLPAEMREAFTTYLAAKPGSPRYTPLRKKLARSEDVQVEQQDLWLAAPGRSSSVGAFTENYFDDALELAHILGLVETNRNYLLARGRASLDHREVRNPFDVTDRDRALLGVWLIDVDGDWLWAFLRAFASSKDRVTVSNRVNVLLETWKTLLNARHLRVGAEGELVVRRRLQELKGITERNVKDGLNLGQPWSWFLIPRLELLVDAGILLKAVPGGLDGYSLSAVGERLRANCSEKGGADELLGSYFSCVYGCEPFKTTALSWERFVRRLKDVEQVLKTSVGYFPLFETAALVCYLENSDTSTRTGIWEIPSVAEMVKDAAKGSTRKALVGISREGHITNFKLVP